MDHGKLVGLTLSNSIDNVKAEVELVGIVEADLLKEARLALNAVNEIVGDHTARGG